jgi:aerobic carbon-monoxide dehydrogenase medium subunit
VKPAPFAYVRPQSLDEAVTALTADGARVLAGGQSLVPMLHMRLLQPSTVVDINRIAELDAVSAGDGVTSIGALVRYTTLETSPVVRERLPLLQHVVGHVGDRQVRNRGTIGGSLAQADPVGEIPLACLVLDATVVALSRSGTREIPAEELILGPYTTSLEPDELVVEVRFPEAPTSFAFREVTRRHNDFAVLAVAVVGSRADDGGWTDLRVGLSGAHDNPILVRLPGSSLDASAIERGVEACLAEIDPPDDVRASAEYRRHLVAIHVARLLGRLGG